APRPDGETLDSFYHGRIRVLQTRRGYRFAVDAPLLAGFIRTRPGDEGLELGTGNGVISLLLSVKPFRKITALELQAGLAGLARRNVELNGLEGRIEIVRADLRTYEPGRKFDLVFSNPPYIRKSAGILGPSAERSAAKHELHGGIGEIMDRTAAWLAPGGRACFVYPEKRRTDFARAASARDFRVLRFRHVLPRAGEPPNLFLAELGLLAEGHPELMPPLVLYGPDGRYTAEAEAVFAGP
ncbi:MAG: methyltransferase, partial [Candidatus Aminicenantes bacterium]|nr:methyltransferase [Candidatus Aminicenantes bacterium]